MLDGNLVKSPSLSSTKRSTCPQVPAGHLLPPVRWGSFSVKLSTTNVTDLVPTGPS